MNNRKNNGFVRNPFLYLLIIVAAVTGFQYFFAGNGVGQSQQINYTELVKEIKNDNVKTISYQPILYGQNGQDEEGQGQGHQIG